MHLVGSIGLMYLVLLALYETLPRSPLVPSLFSYSEISQFEDPAIVERLRVHRRDLFVTYHAFTHHMCSYFLSLAAPLADRLWACSFKGYVWGFTMATTRAVTEKKLIIPLMDFRNFITTDSVDAVFFGYVGLRFCQPLS